MSDASAQFRARYPALLRAQDLEMEALGKSRLEEDPKQCRRLRDLCQAAGYEPPAGLKPDEQEAWWLRIYGMEHESELIWDMVLKEIKAKPRRMAEAIAEATSQWARKKNALIARQAEELQHLKDRPRKGVGSPKEELNIRAREFLKKHPNATAREVHRGIGCALGIVPKLPAWRAVQERRQKERKPTAPRAVSLTPKLEKTTGQDDAELARLVQEQEQEGLVDGSLLKPSEKAKKAKFVPRRKV
jgi:hypothetical protein